MTIHGGNIHVEVCVTSTSRSVRPPRASPLMRTLTVMGSSIRLYCTAKYFVSRVTHPSRTVLVFALLAIIYVAIGASAQLTHIVHN